MLTCMAKMPRRRGMTPDLVCGNKARELVDGEPMCGTHARLHKRCQRGGNDPRLCSCPGRLHWLNRWPGATSCKVCGLGCCPSFVEPAPVLVGDPAPRG